MDASTPFCKRSASVLSVSDRLPFATGLVSYLSSYVSFLRRTTSFGEPPAVRILLHVRGHRQPSDASLAECSIRDGLIHFHIPAATPELFDGNVVLSKTAGSRTTTLAHSSNYRFSPTVFARSVRNLEPWGVTRLRGWFVLAAPLVCRVAGRDRSPPDFLIVVAEGNDSFRGSR
jgi:hypothetical protein